MFIFTYIKNEMNKSNKMSQSLKFIALIFERKDDETISQDMKVY